MKHLEETPWWICDEKDTNFVIYSDTDSIYVHAEPILKHLYPSFDDLNDKEKDNLLEKIALEYQDIITKSYDNLAKDCFNIDSHKLEMKTEAVIRSAYFRKTRRYAQWITKKEGIEKEELDIKGLEFNKSNFPQFFGKFFMGILNETLKGAKREDILKQIKEFKIKIIKGDVNLEDLGNPTSIKTLNSYIGKTPRSGEIFTEVKLKAPAAVKAAIKYNDLLRLWKLDKKYNLITQADKVKYYYLKDNPYKIEALAIITGNVPDKIRDFIIKYIDYNATFDNILLNKFEGFFSDLGWDLTLNPYIEHFKTYEI